MTYTFFLGGYDLEMVTIRDVLKSKNLALFDKKLRWGAKASDYQQELKACNNTPVLIELQLDIPFEGMIIVDHHGSRATERCSLKQICDLIGEPWNAHYALIEANDVGHIALMKERGATNEEMLHIRKLDRQAQGISIDEERLGLEALQNATCYDSLVVVHLPHNRTATVADPYVIGGGVKNLLILSPFEANFYGEGAVISKLTKVYQKSWSGGQLPIKGFWGCEFSEVPQEALLEICR